MGSNIRNIVRTPFGVWLLTGVLVSVGFNGLAGLAGGAPQAPPRTAAKCPLTQTGFGDGSYKPNAPLRSRVGTGFVLSGIVRSGIDCAVVPGAHVEFWFAGPSGYDDVHRGTVIADGAGRYRFESSVLSGNGGWRPHIHLRIAVPGYKPLFAVYFPQPGTPGGALDLVLEPEV